MKGWPLADRVKLHVFNDPDHFTPRHIVSVGQPERFADG